MSHGVNIALFERAAEMVDYFVGKAPARMIETDLMRNDLKSLERHVVEAEAIASQNEMEAADV